MQFGHAEKASQPADEVPLLIYFAVRAWRNHYSSINYDPIEMMGLFWHFVDIVWVFIFPLFYLIER